MGARRPGQDRSRDDDLGARIGVIRALVDLRRRRRLTQAAVAEALRTTQSSISDLENCASDPRLSLLQRYSRVLGCRMGIALSEGPLERFTSWRDRALSYRPTIRSRIVRTREPEWSGTQLTAQPRVSVLDDVYTSPVRDSGYDPYLAAVVQALP
jgi:transcriptional regulator with XRE-family HTH domain